MTRTAEVGGTGTAPAVTGRVGLRGPYDLREVALMGFGHRDEHSFDGVMRLAFCLDGDYETQVGVEVRQEGAGLDLLIRPVGAPLSAAQADAVTAQVARIVSADQDGEEFARVCAADPVLARLHALAPGFRPALFHSPYEAAVWSVISARRARSQGMALRTRLARAHGAVVELAGVETEVLPTPSQLLGVDDLPGLPADRVPRLHAVAAAATRGELSAAGLLALGPDEATDRLRQLPGIGPFYASLVLVRACGAADLLVTEERSRALIAELYGIDEPLDEARTIALAERWRPFRTWATVAIRALSGRLEPPPAAAGSQR